WPGNIRELKNTMERAVFRQGTQLSDLPLSPFASPWAQPAAPESSPASTSRTYCKPAEVPSENQQTSLSVPLHSAVEAVEIRYLAEAMRRAKHNQRQAAALLGLRYHQFRGLYRKHKQAIESPDNT
ncbi:MAG: helix-turn-helix domain-containing protein, partial [Halodesulfovibrio sp.]